MTKSSNQINKKRQLRFLDNSENITLLYPGEDLNENIVFEYDEPQHYIDVMNNILTEHDLNRMQYIKEQLHCRFFRYNERLNLLYECWLKEINLIIIGWQ